jgi:hypothetical protein
LKSTFYNHVFVMLTLSSSNVSIALIEVRIVFTTLNGFEVHSLKIRSAIILTSIGRTGFRVLFIIDQHSVSIFHHSTNSSGSVIVHSFLASCSPKTIISEF